ncbi:MAG: PKD domain-containing protein [Candidatus Aminicenantales bacterium]
MTRRRLSICGLIAAVFLFVFAAFANDNISKSPSLDSWAPRAAADANGNFYVVWNELSSASSGELYFAKYTKSTKSWSVPKNISNSGRVVGAKGKDIEGIAVDVSGTVYVVWPEQSIVRLRWLSGGTWGAAETIGAGNALEGAKIAVQGSGNLYISWWGNDGVVRSRCRINGNWETARQISTSRRSKSADIAVGQNSVIVTFAQKGSYYYNVAYMIRSNAFGSGWSSPAIVSAEEKDQLYPDVEFFKGTTPHIIFSYENKVGEASNVMHCAWTGSGFGSLEAISKAETIHYPSLVEKSGILAAVWQVGGWGNGLKIDYNYFSKGAWGTPAAVPDSSGGTNSDGAFDPSGTGVVVWDPGGEIMAFLITEGEEPPPDNQAPVALFSYAPATGSAPLGVNFDASASHDQDGTIAGYSWSFGDGKKDSGKVAFHTFAKPGTYDIVLTVVDDDGAADTVTHEVEAINKPPVAGFTINPSTGIVPVHIAFDAGASYDPDGTIVLYDWVFNDGFTARGKTVERDFTLAGTYSVKLTVTDNFSQTAFKTKSFVLLGIKPPLNVRWESFTDSSLFMTRTVTDVKWDANPANDAIAEITKYRVFRKAADVTGAAYQLCGETDGATFLWRDTDVQAAGQYAYAVTAMDAAGHESSARGLTSAGIPRKSGSEGIVSRGGSDPIRF